MIVIREVTVKVDLALTPQEALNKVERTQGVYPVMSVVNQMPKGSGDERKLIYFELDWASYREGVIFPEELDSAYRLGGLVADPFAQMFDDYSCPEFADSQPTACQWQNDIGEYWFLTLGKWEGQRRVIFNRWGVPYDNQWDGTERWLFAGVPRTI